jgi:hypothetical protein
MGVDAAAATAQKAETELQRYVIEGCKNNSPLTVWPLSACSLQNMEQPIVH